jgi:hypothetical protein
MASNEVADKRPIARGAKGVGTQAKVTCDAAARSREVFRKTFKGQRFSRSHIER